MDDAKGTPAQSCRLCSALNNEIEKTRTNGETEREVVLKFLLRGHLKLAMVRINHIPFCNYINPVHLWKVLEKITINGRRGWREGVP